MFFDISRTQFRIYLVIDHTCTHFGSNTPLCRSSSFLTGFKFRMRFIVEEPWGESESCPHVSEAMTCDHPINLLWRVTSHGPCVPQDGACGHGTQEQTVECVTAAGTCHTSSSTVLSFCIPCFIYPPNSQYRILHTHTVASMILDVMFLPACLLFVFRWPTLTSSPQR